MASYSDKSRCVIFLKAWPVVGCEGLISGQVQRVHYFSSSVSITAHVWNKTSKIEIYFSTLGIYSTDLFQIHPSLTQDYLFY
jgi:hypothetical protein